MSNSVYGNYRNVKTVAIRNRGRVNHAFTQKNYHFLILRISKCLQKFPFIKKSFCHSCLRKNYRDALLVAISSVLIGISFDQDNKIAMIMIFYYSDESVSIHGIHVG